MAAAERLLLPFAAGHVGLPEGRILLLNAVPDAGLAALPRARTICEQGFRPDHDALAAAGWAVTPRAEGTFDAALVILPRARAAGLGLIARALAAVPPGGLVVVAGARGDGIDGALARVRATLDLAGSAPRAHGKVFWLARPAALPPAVAEWAAAAAPAPNREGFLTSPGMFSPDRGDRGSRLLAEVVRGRLGGRVAEFGAGWGWLAQALIAGNPGIATLDLFEADHASLAAARVNVTDARVRFHWADAARLAAAAGPFDHVVTNAPLHRGRAAEPALGQAFIAAAARTLGRDGTLWLVALRQLPFEAAFAGAFRSVETVAAQDGFKLIAGHAPKPLRPRPAREAGGGGRVLRRGRESVGRPHR
jgi:16S rRNA (guanine1207-N2)-methyltransferase